MNAKQVPSRNRWMRLLLALGFCTVAWRGGAQSVLPPLGKWRLGKTANEARFVGRDACVQCHADIAQKQAATAMAQALVPAGQDPLLQKQAPLTFTLGEYSYRIERQGAQFSYTVTNGQQSVSEPLVWSFGHGASGETFVIQYQGIFYETRVSFFTQLGRLDLTPGAPRAIPASLKDAIGQPQRHSEALACFTCHATPTPAAREVKLNEFTPGLHCEACHGAGEKHVAALKAGKLALAKQEIFNPRAWSADDVNQQFCGACHRSWEAVMQMPERGGPTNIRFQPYRLANSKCYQDPDDQRIGCTACHDPHGALSHGARAYDAKCLACHRGGNQPSKASTKPRTAPACRTGKQDCTACHMPKVEPPHLHFKFTDHWIRIVKAGEEYPQ